MNSAQSEAIAEAMTAGGDVARAVSLTGKRVSFGPNGREGTMGRFAVGNGNGVVVITPSGGPTWLTGEQVAWNWGSPGA